MTLLIISPDYASHLLPLATIGTAWRDAGERVIVATGPATAAIVESFGFERVNLQLGKGSNAGVIRVEEQPAGEDDTLRGFFEATREGPVQTLLFQARERLSDLMWEPELQARAVQRIVETVAPDAIIVDHLAFSARVGLTAGRIPYADVVLGHPSALPVGDELYGFPPEWPAAFRFGEDDLAELQDVCDRVSKSFTAEWNRALTSLDPEAEPSSNAFAEHGQLLMLNYPSQLSPDARTNALPPHIFLGSAVREEPSDSEVDAWLQSDEPFVYVSFGSFLSVRDDVLARVAAALAQLGVRAAVALGSAAAFDMPAGWLVREFLPQVTLLRRAMAAVTHGGNNSVTEAMTSGVPLLVLPFSTDQFAGAAAIERAGLGEVLAPNTATVDEIAESLTRVLALSMDPLVTVPGREVAYTALKTSRRIASASPAASR